MEPFGPIRESGAVAAMLANVNRDTKRRPQPFTALEAVTMFPLEPAPPAPVDVGSKLRAWAAGVQQRAARRGRVIKRPR